MHIPPPFPIKVKIAPAMSAVDTLLFNVSENARRKPLSAMDWATVIPMDPGDFRKDRLRTDIGKRMGWST